MTPPKALALNASAHQLHGCYTSRETAALGVRVEYGSQNLVIWASLGPCLDHSLCAAQDTSSAMHMLRSERRVLPVPPVPVVTEEAADPALKQPLRHSPKAQSPALAPVLMLGGKARGDEEAVRRPEASGGGVESGGAEAEDAAAAQVTHCACRSGLGPQPIWDMIWQLDTLRSQRDLQLESSICLVDAEE